MKRLVIALLALAVSFSAMAQKPQDAPKPQKGVDHERFEAEKVAYITQQLSVSVEEAQAFWPVYNQAVKEQREVFAAVREAKKALREAINEGSRLMVNITNDGWFGRSTAPYQHLNLVRYRAIENGMPTARLANSGITAFIDQYGHFDKNTEIFTDRVVIRKMQLKSRDTVYQHIGDSVETALLWFFLIYLISAFALWKCRKFRQPLLQE